MKVGGQAVIEGVLMIGKKAVIAVRKENGKIVVEEIGRIRRGKLSKIPFVRGIVNLYYSLDLGIKALNRSAEIVSEERMKTSEKFFSLLLAVALAIGLFFLLPMFLTNLLKSLRGNEALFSLVEGLLRIGFFLVYVWVISLMRDVKRLFQYHGAEHKTIHTYESREDLTVENVAKHSKIHPRCGTNFLMIFLISSVLLFSFLSLFFEPTLKYRVVSRLIAIPLIASLAYEILKILDRLPEKLMKILAFPGLALQLLTTAEPSDDQIEVAIASLEEALKGDGEDLEIMA